MKERLLLVLLLIAPAYAASTNTVTVGDNDSYIVDNANYTVRLGMEDAVILEKQDGTSQILRVDSCINLPVIRTCLDSASEDSASFSETSKVAEISVEHDLSSDSVDMGSEVEGTIALTYEGELAATDVQIFLDLPPGITSESGESGRVIFPLTTVRGDRDFTYTIITERNGTYKVGGTLQYHDGNQTITETIENLTLKVTVPILFTVEYDDTTGVDSTELQIDVERDHVDNFTITIVALLPPQANITSTSKGVTKDDTTLTYKKYLNTSETGINATYYFLSPPTQPLQIFITYKNDTDTHTLSANYSYAQLADDAPALAVSVDPVIENTTGTLRVIITGNRTGNLSIESTLLNKTLVAKNDTYEFPLSPSPRGLYAVKVSFASISPYGSLQVARGVISVEVKAPKVVQPTQQTNAESQTQTNSTTSDLPATTSESHPMVWVGVAAAIALLIILLVVVKRFSDPVAKLEHLVEKVGTMRAALEKEGKLGSHESADYKKLERMERKLAALQRKL